MNCPCYLVAAAFAAFGLFSFVLSIIQPLLRFVFRLSSSVQALTTRFGRWAIVTGSTDGIGEAIAFNLAERGFDLFLISRNKERLEETKKKINQKFPLRAITIFAFDFSSQSSSWASKLSELQSIIDTLDVGVLINNVGLSYPSALKFDELSSDILDDLISVNIRSVYRMTHMVLPGMRKRRRGAICCIGSGASETPTEPLYAGYAGAKGAVEAFCRSLQAECVSDNILVQCQTPLLVTTKLSKCRTASLTVLTTQDYAAASVSALESSYPSLWLSTTVCPNFVHNSILLVSQLLPLGLWNRHRLQATSSIRARYLAKTKAQ